MTEEIHATFQIENIHSSRNSIRHILNGYAPRNEEKSRIYGLKRGLDFIADHQNTINEENLHQLYQISSGDYLPDEDRLLPDHFYLCVDEVGNIIRPNYVSEAVEVERSARYPFP